MIQPKKGRPKAVINPDSCTGCEVCVAICPVDCIDKLPGPEYPTMNSTCVIDQPRCIGCFLCEKICPWDAITMVPPQEAPATEAGTPPLAGLAMEVSRDAVHRQPQTPVSPLSIEEFRKIDLRIGVVVAAEDHPNADRPIQPGGTVK